MKKSERHSLIKQLIMQHSVSSQEDLIKLLKEAGVDATQATISRDIRELRIVKDHDSSGNVRYGIFSQPTENGKDEKLAASIKEELLSIEQVQFNLILKTNMRSADVVSNWLDEVNYPEIAGTIAGVDTILIICHNETEATTVAERLLAMR